MDAKGNDLVELPKDIWKMSGLNRIDVSDNLMTGEAHKHVSNMSQICHEKVLSFICVYVLQATFITKLHTLLATIDCYCLNKLPRLSLLTCSRCINKHFTYMYLLGKSFITVVVSTADQI